MFGACTLTKLLYIKVKRLRIGIAGYSAILVTATLTLTLALSQRVNHTHLFLSVS